jgi:hypothetical protein
LLSVPKYFLNKNSEIMQQNQSTGSPEQSFIPAGWIGGFSENPPAQPYPNSELLSSLPFEGNLDNIPNINRMLRAKWPEFSWETTKGDPIQERIKCLHRIYPGSGMIIPEESGLLYVLNKEFISGTWCYDEH